VGRAGLSYGYVVQLAMEQTSSARLPLREDTAVHALEVGTALVHDNHKAARQSQHGRRCLVALLR
jgi:hypothetical protein